MAGGHDKRFRGRPPGSPPTLHGAAKVAVTLFLAWCSVCGLLPVSAAAAEPGGAQGATDVPAVAKMHPRQKTYMKRTWGIEILYVQQTAAGYMLEFRYKVLDAEKAAALFERQTKPVLKHPESGATLIVPTPAKTGALRNSNKPHADTTYWMSFANPGKLVEPGDVVNIEIGDFLAEGIVVR